ncbi:MAG TPA: Ig domain-containing protein [Tepidisphaeraceae bacterium]
MITLCAAVATRGANVEDVFGRDASVNGLVVPDWEGYMANPAIEFFVAPPPGAMLPVKVTMGADDPRLYFDLPSTAGAEGPRKEVTIVDGKPAAVYIAIFPARKKQNAERKLAVVMSDARGRGWRGMLAVHELAVESHDAEPVYPIKVDYSQDKTSFYKDPAHRDTFQQAIVDWAYYLADLHERPVAAGSEKTWIFDRDGFKHGRWVINPEPYTGMLLYTYGIQGPEHRSGGEPSSAGNPQEDADGHRLPLHRSGGVEVQIDGNYNTLGWARPFRDDEWWRATNLGDVPNDLYSIVHHESGHALFFNPTNKDFHRSAVMTSDTLRAYFGSDPKTDEHDHFDGIVDPASLHGAFGNEYHGNTPYGRWLITKFDLLAAQAVGYKLRATAPVLPLTLSADPLPAATAGKAFRAQFHATGGIPFYDWRVAGGAMPPGLTLNRYTGELTGAARRVGNYPVTIEVRDYHADGTPVSKEFALTVERETGKTPAN